LLVISSAIIIALVAIVIIIWKNLFQENLKISTIAKPYLAIMYFQNKTGDKNFDIWKDSLCRMLITELSQSRYLRVLPNDRLFEILKKLNFLEKKNYSTEDLKKIASMENVTHILQGFFIRSGSSLRINATLQDADTMEIVVSEVIEGRVEEGFYKVMDELSRKIESKFSMTRNQIAGDLYGRGELITTSSSEAFKYYSKAVKYFNKLDYHQSIILLKKAVEIDPKFAMAYRLMGKSYFALDYFDKSEIYLQKALELSHRVSVREHYIILGTSERDIYKRIDALEKLIELYPGDLTGNILLGKNYQAIEELNKSNERFKVSIQGDKSDWRGYLGLTENYLSKGLYEKARKIMIHYLGNYSDNSGIRECLSKYYLIQREYDRALVEADKATAFIPDNHKFFILKGDIYLCKSDFINAEKVYRKLMEAEKQTAYICSIEKMAFLYILQGKFEEAENYVIKALQFTESINDEYRQKYEHLLLSKLYQKSGKFEKALTAINKARCDPIEDKFNRGLIYLELKSIDESQRAADELREKIQQGLYKKQMRLYYTLMGKIELKRENFSVAVEYFQKAISLLPPQEISTFYKSDEHAIFINYLALAYYKSGDLDRARKEYEKLILLTIGRLNNGDIYAKGFYMLGKIYQQLGKRERAIENYEKFLDTWKNSDLGLLEIDEAKRQLVILLTEGENHFIVNPS